MIRKLDHTEFAQAINLSLEVFTQCGTEDFNEEGLKTFRSFIHSESRMNELTIYGAFNPHEELIGIIGTKNDGTHISLFFIHQDYHRKGIGQQLFSHVILNSPVTEVTVNSSTYAVPFYQSLGFERIGEVEEFHGLRSIPMRFIKGKTTRHPVPSAIMNIIRITDNKKQYLDLLLLADEQESMIDRYLERGEMFILEDHGIKAVCVVTDEGKGICELKNIAVSPNYQRQGYGKKLLNHLVTHYSGKYCQMIVGTGDVPSAVGFYKSCGFIYSHRVENFFTDNYDHSIVEDGVLLKDMVYMKQDLSDHLVTKPYEGHVPACGVFCGACPTYTRDKKPCPGAERNKSRCEKCKTFHLCCAKKGITHCHQCSTFPCPRLKAFTKRWLKYGQDFIENQKLLAQVGEIEFIRIYNKKTNDD